VDAYRTMPTHIYEQVVATHLRTTDHRPIEGDAFEAYIDQWRGESGQEAYLEKVRSSTRGSLRSSSPSSARYGSR
jgi:hypothetical protein